MIEFGIFAAALGLLSVMFYFTYMVFCMFGRYELTKRAWEASIDMLVSRNRKRINLEREAYVMYGEMERKNLTGGIDRILSYSGITGRFGWVTAEVVMAAVSLLIFLEMLAVVLMFGKFFPAVGIAVFTLLLLYETGNLMRALRGRRINDELLHLEDLMEIYAYSNEDILQIMGKAALKIRGPLQGELLKMLYEAENSGQISLALRRLCNRIENKYFKDLILNLEICSRYMANYQDVLKAAKKILKQDEQNRKKIQKLYRKSFLYSVMFLGIGAVSIYGMGIFAGVEGNIWLYLWRAGSFSKGLVIYMAATAAFGLWNISSKAVL